MDDQELEKLLKSLTPRKAPIEMDAVVLGASREAYKEREGPIRWFVFASAASIAAALILLFFLLYESDPEENDGLLLGEAEISSSEEALEAKALLLELKINRLKRQAPLYAKGNRYRTDLDILEKELKTIDRYSLDKAELEDTEKTDKPDDKGGTKNEKGRNSYYPVNDGSVHRRAMPG